jgi:NitT/TauT family transport system ATP-binding protein
VLQRLLLELWSESRKTVVFITHDLGEAIALSDRVALMSARPGTIKEIADIDIPRPRDPAHMHEDPRFVAIYRRLWDSLEEEMAQITTRWAAAS